MLDGEIRGMPAGQGVGEQIPDAEADLRIAVARQ